MMDKHKANRILKIITEYEEVRLHLGLYEEVRLHLGLSHEEFRDKFYREVLMSDTPIAAPPVEDISKVAYCAQDNNSSLCTVKTCGYYDEKRTNHCKVVSCKILGRTPTTGVAVEVMEHILDEYEKSQKLSDLLNSSKPIKYIKYEPNPELEKRTGVAAQIISENECTVSKKLSERPCENKTCQNYNSVLLNNCVRQHDVFVAETRLGKQLSDKIRRIMSKEECKAILNADFGNQLQEDTTMKELDPKVKEKQDKAKEDVEKRFTYHSPKEGQPEKYTSLRNMSKDLALAILAMVPDSRERSLALTCLEECSMWANAGIARHE